jgi:hypothetical protein
MINPSRSIADDRKKDKAPPADFVDLFWRYKIVEHNPNSRERDFLRFTPLGNLYMNAQIIRPYLLFIAVVIGLIWTGDDVDEQGRYYVASTKMYYMLVDLIFCIPLLLMISYGIMYHYVVKYKIISPVGGALTAMNAI